MVYAKADILALQAAVPEHFRPGPGLDQLLTSSFVGASNFPVGSLRDPNDSMHAIDAVLFSGTGTAASAERDRAALSGSAGGLNLTSSTRDRADAQQRRIEEKRERDNQDAYHRLLLDRIEYLDLQMEREAIDLREKYGPDFIDGMAAAILTEDENALAKTDDEKRAAMAGRMLNPDGSLKPEWANTPEGRYIQAWAESAKRKAEFAEYPSASRERQREIEQGLEGAEYSHASLADTTERLRGIREANLAHTMDQGDQTIVRSDKPPVFGS